MTEFLWSEKYRPNTVEDCILPIRLKAPFQAYVDTKQVPHLMLAGGAGVGKSTVAEAMCKQIGLNYIFINSSKERGIDILRTKIENYASTMSLTGGSKVIILDEADYLTPEAQAALRGVMEKFSDNCTFIMTCNFKSRLIDALHSRTAVIDFKLQNGEKIKMANQFLARVEMILKTENVEYDKSVAAAIITKFFPDYRRTLNELQRLATTGKIDRSALESMADIRKVSDLVKYLKDKNFGEMRKWVVMNSDVDPARIYRRIYDSLYDYFKPESIPQAILIIAKYQYQAGFVADNEINLVACLTEIMVDCEIR